MTNGEMIQEIIENLPKPEPLRIFSVDHRVLRAQGMTAFEPCDMGDVVEVTIKLQYWKDWWVQE